MGGADHGAAQGAVIGSYHVDGHGGDHGAGHGVYHGAGRGGDLEHNAAMAKLTPPIAAAVTAPGVVDRGQANDVI